MARPARDVDAELKALKDRAIRRVRQMTARAETPRPGPTREPGRSSDAPEPYASKERGVDIQATRLGQTLLLEAMGYPSKTYRDPRRAGELKPSFAAMVR